jgi:hypothetical protein
VHIYRLSQHSLDIVFKLEAEQLGTETLNFGVVQYDVRNVFLGRDDGEETYQRLRARVESGSGLEPEERLDLVFLPLMHNARPPVEIVSGALALAQQLPEEQQRQTLASLIGLGQRFLEQRELDALLEGLMATSIGQQLIERGFEQGLAKGKRDDVLKVLTKRFGAVPAAWSEQLQQVNDLERLDALLDAALAAQSLWKSSSRP